MDGQKRQQRWVFRQSGIVALVQGRWRGQEGIELAERDPDFSGALHLCLLLEVATNPALMTLVVRSIGSSKTAKSSSYQINKCEQYNIVQTDLRLQHRPLACWLSRGNYYLVLKCCHAILAFLVGRMPS